MIHSVLTNVLLFQKRAMIWFKVCDNKHFYHWQMHGIKYIIDLICILQVYQYICYKLYLVSSPEETPHFLMRVELKSFQFWFWKFNLILKILNFNSDFNSESFFSDYKKMAVVGDRRMVVVVLQSRMSLAIWLHGLLLTWERATYSQ